jgi:hypothetical protein
MKVIKGRSQINGDDPNNIRCEASRHIRNKERKYMKHKSNELATHSKKIKKNK